jgi:uncharacterized protein YciI
MMYFFCRLIPPRPTFPQDMTEKEAEVMRDHVAYWSSMAEKGIALVFGPVADPEGAWGLGVLEVEDEKEVQSITSNDPVMRSGIGVTYKILPMPGVVVGRKRE